MPPLTAARFELELISHRELADMVSWHERLGEQRGFAKGFAAGRDQMNQWLFIGGIVIGLIVGISIGADLF